MNLTAFLKSSQDLMTKVMAILSVAGLKAAAMAREAWRNRRDLAPVVGRYLVVFMLGMICAITMLRARDAKTIRDVPFTTREELAAKAAAQAAAAEITEEPEVSSPVADMAAIQDAAMKREAQYMARVLYGTARYHSRETQEAVCWCIINRVESSLFPNSVEEVCSQSVQWVGYSNNNPVTQELYDVAMGVIQAWHDKGIRMIPQDYLYLSWSEDEIVLRTSFNETARTHYWHAAG